METMFMSGIEEWKEQWKEQWKQQWKEQIIAKVKSEMKAEGKAEGKAEDLIALLAGRFGTVTPSWLTHIQGANLATLEHWFKRAIVAPDLPSVFNPPG